MKQFWHNFKIVLNTLAFVIVISSIVGTYHYYNYQLQAKERSLVQLPDFEHTNNQQFLDNVNQCVDYLYHNDVKLQSVNRELLLAQAALESGWGTSRFAREGHNLFGMRTYDLTEPHMLPSNNPKKWGVKVYMHECDSVLHYINTLNNGTAYDKYRELRDKGVEDSLKYVETLGAYASDKNYFTKVKSIINKLRTEYDIPQLD